MSEDCERNYWNRQLQSDRDGAMEMARHLSAQEQFTLLGSVKFENIDAVRYSQTEQGKFEYAMRSLDRPFSDDDNRKPEFSYGTREIDRMISRLDAPYREHMREVRFWRAIYKLRKYPELQKTLRAIRTFRVRQKIISALKIKDETYRRRFFDLTRILGFTI